MSEVGRLRRWRLVLGGNQAEGTGVALREADAELDAALSALYDAPTVESTQPRRHRDQSQMQCSAHPVTTRGRHHGRLPP